MENSDIKHIAIIMDGNRRWAKEHNLESKLGHKKGAEVLEEITKYCNKIGLKYLTVYAFSTENWKRTKEEVGAIMKILEIYLDRFLKTADLEDIKLRILGDKEGVPKNIRDKMNKMEERTKDNKKLNLNIAFNYGGRAEIVRAAKALAEDVKNNKIKIEDIDEEMFSKKLYTYDQQDPDLVIRTSGECRTSNFLPWQTTYSEYLFLDKFWPDFTTKDIDNAIKEFSNRHIRKGK